MYFDIDTPDGTMKEFQRHAYQLIDNPTLTFIHYKGSEAVAVDFHYRGSKDARPFFRTSPSTLQRLRTLVKQDTAGVVYKKEVASMSCDNTKVATEMPRNIKQLRNLRFDYLHKSRLSKDGLYNIHDIAYDIPGFVWKIITFPDLVVIFGLKELLDELDKVLLLDSTNQLLSYDTTFQLGDFYVSPLLFRHTVFKNRPVIPAIFMLHERKQTITHCAMMKECVCQVPSLSTAKAPLVTDREKAISNAIQSEIPFLDHVYCWNHVLRDIRFWLTRHGAPSADISIYSDDVRSLLHSPTKEDYDVKFEKVTSKWDVIFLEYYLKEISPHISRFARWELEKKGIYNPYSGVTNNQSESLNMVIKDLMKWKEAPIDCIVLSLYLLQSFYVNEIKRGFCGIGEYKLDAQFHSIVTDPSSIEYTPFLSPESIVDSIRKSESDAVDCHEIEESTTQSVGETNIESGSQTMLSSFTRARLVISNNGITYDQSLHVFNVKGSSSVHVVSLFPEPPKCSCPSTTICYHIIAAKLFLGMDVSEKKPSKLILSQLRKNVRKKHENKAGRKRPRKRDTDNLSLEAEGKAHNHLFVGIKFRFR